MHKTQELNCSRVDNQIQNKQRTTKSREHSHLHKCTNIHDDTGQDGMSESDIPTPVLVTVRMVSMQMGSGGGGALLRLLLLLLMMMQSEHCQILAHGMKIG